MAEVGTVWRHRVADGRNRHIRYRVEGRQLHLAHHVLVLLARDDNQNRPREWVNEAWLHNHCEEIP